MPETRTDFVIQISTSASAPDMSGESAEFEGSPVVAELQRCLKPGSEIGLVFRGYVAITSVLWLSGPTTDRSVRAGVRLVGISARPSAHLESLPYIDEPRTDVPS
jgi:hypothetical protein